ncbi:TraR/DksA family transcriptional regulator [Microbacterium hominis]|uniref:TraR/DksA family transcriptional regulator n=1 Tax=Microbacterium hominis TaxID=162426 RepID=A0A7D4PZD2_9MICO|nr:TraR/DksA C4-type zinc finger protein [Microbacterium hominis]QKJ18078.1 TraR/DksA family transcriptional regulator [Microbacterium hominis]
MSTDSRAAHGALLAGLRSDAVARRDALSAAAAELRRDRGAETADDEHDPEGVTLSMEWERIEGLRLAAEAELAEIDEALSRWRTGDYGRCEDCGRSIPIERLRVRPAARRCVPCAERAGA